MKVAVLGTGSWGTALGQTLLDNGHEVFMWGRNTVEVNDLKMGRNSKHFDNLQLLPMHATTSIKEIPQDIDLLVLATPSQALEDMIQMINKEFKKELLIVNVAKGFHNNTNQRISEYIRSEMKPELLKGYVSLIGPSHAEEVILKMETLVTAVSLNRSHAELVQKAFSNDAFRVYTSTDEISAEIGAAVKNVIALASGIVAGLGLGDNSKAALITRGLAEMSRLGEAMGGQKDTFLGLTGVGDLIVTAMSDHSRNYQAGKLIGQANEAASFLKDNNKTVEGIHAVKTVNMLREEYNVSMPISENVYQIIYENKTPQEAISALMSRSLKPEDQFTKNSDI